MLPSHIGIIKNHRKDPYQRTSIMESKGPRVFFVAHVTRKKFPENTVGVLEVGVFFLLSGGGGRNPGLFIVLHRSESRWRAPHHSQVRWRVVGVNQKQMTWLGQVATQTFFIFIPKFGVSWSKLTHNFWNGLVQLPTYRWYIFLNDSSNKKIGGFGVGSWVSRSFWEILGGLEIRENWITILNLSGYQQTWKNQMGFSDYQVSPLVFSRMRSEGFPFIVGVWGWTCVRFVLLPRRRLVVVSSSPRRRVVVANSSPTR